MNRRSILIFTALLLILVNLGLVIFDAYQYLDFIKFISTPSFVQKAVALGWLVMFATHIILFIFTVITLKFANRYFTSGIIMLAFGVVSFLFVLLHFVVVEEAGNEYPQGWPIDGLVRFAWIALFVHLTFFLNALVYFILVGRKPYKSVPAVFREQMFMALHITGIISSVLGLFWVIFQFIAFNNRTMRFFDLIPYGFIILPYLLVLCGWGITTVLDRRPVWLDEKQRSDIYAAGMLSLMVPLPLPFALIINEYFTFSKLPVFIDGTVNILWMPFYIFISIFCFSVTALYKFRKE